jgi:hypothetical protein
LTEIPGLAEIWRKANICAPLTPFADDDRVEAPSARTSCRRLSSARAESLALVLV